MKKLCGLLAVLLAASPVLAAVRITAQPDGNKVAICYATDGEKVRAFALDITVDKGLITGISDFMRGESTAAKPGYGIFPANFARFILRINSSVFPENIDPHTTSILPGRCASPIRFSVISGAKLIIRF